MAYARAQGAIGAQTQSIALRYGGNIHGVDESCRGCPNLRVLDISHCGLTFLPKAMFALTQLRELCASYNRLVVLEAAIGDLANLEVLRLANNTLVAVSAELFTLPLRVLDLSNNMLRNVNKAICKLKRLGSADGRLVLHGNPDMEMPPAASCGQDADGPQRGCFRAVAAAPWPKQRRRRRRSGGGFDHTSKHKRAKAAQAKAARAAAMQPEWPLGFTNNGTCKICGAQLKPGAARGAGVAAHRAGTGCSWVDSWKGRKLDALCAALLTR